jgi:hypothetical protein
MTKYQTPAEGSLQQGFFNILTVWLGSISRTVSENLTSRQFFGLQMPLGWLGIFQFPLLVRSRALNRRP